MARRYIDRAALIAEIERRKLNHIDLTEFNSGYKNAIFDVLSFLDTLEVKDPYEQCIQYDSIKSGIQAHAETYSFNIQSLLFNQLTKEQQALWRKEIEQAVISGGDAGYLLAKDPRYKENLEVKEVDLEKEIQEAQRNYKTIEEYKGYPCTMYADDIEWIARHFYELGLKAKGEQVMKLVNVQIIKDELERLIRDYRFYSSTEAKYRYEAYKELSEWLDNLDVEELSDDLEETAKFYAATHTEFFDSECKPHVAPAFIAGAKWQEANLWKDAQGDDLPEIDREVIALVQDYQDDAEHLEIAFAHRPPEYWNGKSILTGKVTRYEPKRHDKGGWNLPNVKYWLDVELPK